MAYFDSIETMFKVYDVFLRKVVSDPSVGAKLAKSKVKIRFNYTDPKALSSSISPTRPRRKARSARTNSATARTRPTSR